MNHRARSRIRERAKDGTTKKPPRGDFLKKTVQDLERMAEIYLAAERRERASIAFYRHAASRATAESEKKLLLELAEKEMEHLSLMQARYEEIMARLNELRRT